MTVLAIILGIALGFSAAFLIAGLIINKSSNKGDSKGDFDDFSRSGIEVLEKQDRIKRNLSISDFM